MAIWNPWHGCRKYSPGCQNCYVYRRDESVGRDASKVEKNAEFDLPLRKDRQGNWKLKPQDGPVYACMTSDFFLDVADPWRQECWDMIRTRRDLEFIIITKRIARFSRCLPPDWGDGYPNVTICCTCEDQTRADQRLPIFLEAPIRRRFLIHEPLLGPIQAEKYLASGLISQMICGGESGSAARPCHYEWILSLREQCIRQNVAFHFKQTGALFVKDGKTYRVRRPLQHSQAAKAGIDWYPEAEAVEGWLARDLFQRIAESPFRSRFHLSGKDRDYVQEKGMETIRRHAEDFIAARLAPETIPNDGKQTPMRGHPIFLAQHATACCCRECLRKWHGIPPGRALTPEEQTYVADTLMEWVRRQMESAREPQVSLFDSTD